MREQSPIQDIVQGLSDPEILADRYVLGVELGVGATARVYRAWDPVLGVARAVKLLSVPDAYRAALRERLRVEARAMARLNHPNVLRVYDIRSVNDDDFVVMELAEGGSLQALVDAEGALPLELACDALLQTLSALGAAHQAGVVHRDVKPQNILLNVDGQALLADFGIALLEDADRHTRTGAAMGSMSYMAPEQRVDARNVGPAADIYAAGATLYHLLTAANPIDLFASPLYSPRWTALPPQVRPVIQRATAYDPSSRYPSAAAMALDLRAALLSACEAEHTDGIGLPAITSERPFSPDAYTDLSRDPSTLFDIPRPPSASPQDAALALPLTLGPLLLGLVGWFLLASPQPTSATFPPSAAAAAAAAPSSSLSAEDAAATAQRLADTEAAASDASSSPTADAVAAASSSRLRYPLNATGNAADSDPAGSAAAASAAWSSGDAAHQIALSNGKLKGVSPSSATMELTSADPDRPVAGRWLGRLGGRLVALRLDGASGGLEGVLTAADGEPLDLAAATARYDSASRTLHLLLRFPEHWPDASATDLRLSADGTTLSGRIVVDGQPRTLRLQRSDPSPSL